MSRFAFSSLALITLCLLTTHSLTAQRGGGGGGGGSSGSARGGGGRATTTSAMPAPQGPPTVAALAVDPASHLAGITKAISAIDSALAQKAPAGLSTAEQSDWEGETKWLTSSRSQLAQLAQKLGAFAKGDSTTTKPDAQRIADANVQFIALQRQLNTAGERRTQTISNASKARHDIAMNAIRNMK